MWNLPFAVTNCCQLVRPIAGNVQKLKRIDRRAIEMDEPIEGKRGIQVLAEEAVGRLSVRGRGVRLGSAERDGGVWRGIDRGDVERIDGDIRIVRVLRGGCGRIRCGGKPRIGQPPQQERHRRNLDGGGPRRRAVAEGWWERGRHCCRHGESKGVAVDARHRPGRVGGIIVVIGGDVHIRPDGGDDVVEDDLVPDGEGQVARFAMLVRTVTIVPLWVTPVVPAALVSLRTFAVGLLKEFRSPGTAVAGFPATTGESQVGQQIDCAAWCRKATSGLRPIT